MITDADQGRRFTSRRQDIEMVAHPDRLLRPHDHLVEQSGQPEALQGLSDADRRGVGQHRPGDGRTNVDQQLRDARCQVGAEVVGRQLNPAGQVGGGQLSVGEMTEGLPADTAVAVGIAPGELLITSQISPKLIMSQFADRRRQQGERLCPVRKHRPVT